MGEGTEVAIRQAGQVSAIPDAKEITALYKLGQAMAGSGMFKDARQPFQAMTKLMLGRDLGLSATASMTGIYLVEGRIELGSNLQAQMIRTWLGLSGERYDYSVDKHTDDECEVTIYRVPAGAVYGNPAKEGYELLGTGSFNKADATRAGLLGKDNWKKYPRNMYFARAMSNAIAFHCPEVTGGVRLYAPGEVANEEDPGARAVDVGDFEARAEAIQAQDQPQGEQPQGESHIQDAHVVEDDKPPVEAQPEAATAAPDQYEGLTPEQRAEMERLDQEFGATMPEFEEGDVGAVAENVAQGQAQSFAEASLHGAQPAPQPQPAQPQPAQVMELQALVHQGLLEIGEKEQVIAARLRGAGENVTALQNLLKFIENKKQQMEAGK